MPDDKSLDILGIKPVADSVNRLTRAAVDGASAFLSRICLPAAEELGLLFRDKVASWRARNAVLVVEHARDSLKDSGANLDQLSAHPRIVGQILELGSWSDGDEIQQLWGGLLASSCTEDGKDESNLIFTNLLGQITSLQARLITYSCEAAEKKVSGGGWIVAGPMIIDLAEVKRITQVDDVHRLDRELDHLRALELMAGFDTHTQRANVTPTSLCLQFYMRCKGHRGSPVEFYNVKDPDAQLDEQFESHVAGKVPKASGKQKTSKRRLKRAVK